ncbi:MAG: transferrin-binding protein-like solute binding protein, partial [Campylobacterota bacterium]|nr:transferrin-binding protein-like solute binding protein [Campylobacterota bacterium]
SSDNIESQSSGSSATSSSDNIESVVGNTRNITLDGRTIDPTTSEQQAVNIQVDNLTGDLKLDESLNMIMEDMDGNSISSSSDDTVVWGHWADNTDKKWVAGQTTPTSVLENVQNSATVTNASYKGNVIGSVNGNDAIKNDASNAVDINFQLGGNKNTMDGNIKFDTQSGDSWNSNFEGTTSGSNFTTTNGGSVGGTGAGSEINSGSVDGSFYGDDAQAVGGTFDLKTDSDTASGVFKATK